MPVRVGGGWDNRGDSRGEAGTSRREHASLPISLVKTLHCGRKMRSCSAVLTRNSLFAETTTSGFSTLFFVYGVQVHTDAFAGRAAMALTGG